MTERFIYDGLHIRDLQGKIPPILTSNDKIRDKYLNELNKLHDENNYLKSLKWNQDCITEISVYHQIKESLEAENSVLVKENERLKQEMGDLGATHAEEINKIEDEFDEEILKLEKENEQLKQQLELYQELYPSGKWICDLNSDELKKELEE